jgi:hypothetical protein
MFRPLLLEEKRRTTLWLSSTNVFPTQPNTAPICFLPNVKPCTCDRRTDGRTHKPCTVSQYHQPVSWHTRSSYTLLRENKPTSETVLCVVRPRCCCLFSTSVYQCTVQRPMQVLQIIKLHYTNMFSGNWQQQCFRTPLFMATVKGSCPCTGQECVWESTATAQIGNHKNKQN